MIAPFSETCSLATGRCRALDVCVVGAGPVGLTLALELARLGQRVLVLESGGRSARGETRSLSDAALADPNAHDDMRIAVARQLGGTSNLWGGRCIPYDPIDFAERPGVLPAQWPISPKDVAPHYAAACRYATCGGDVFDCPIPRVEIGDDRFTFTSLERWSTRPPFQKTHRAALAENRNIDVRLGATVVDLEFAHDRRVGAVVVARPDGRRFHVPVNRLVLAGGGVETARLLLVAQRRKPRAFGGVDGPLGRYYMGHLIGQIADISFINANIDAAYDFFIDAHGSYVRRRFVASERLQLAEQLTNVALWPVVPETADPRHGSGVLSLVALLMSCGPLARRFVPEAIRIRHIKDDMPLLPHVRNMMLDLPRTISSALSALYRRYVSGMRHPAFYVRNRDMRYALAYHAEHLPNPDSRVRLIDDVDRLGMPRVEIDLRFSEADARGVVRTHELLADWLRSGGLGQLEFRQPPQDNIDAVLRQARHGTHQIGVVRMARTSSEGVVDGNLKCFGLDNLYVAGTAVLPTSSQASPTLTAMALAVRLAHHLAVGSATDQQRRRRLQVALAMASIARLGVVGSGTSDADAPSNMTTASVPADIKLSPSS